jgi:glycosyltransferase involved in cell wall biosynthesis
MRVAIVSRSWFTETKGGAERYVYELSKGLTNLGHEVVSVSREGSDLPNRHLKVWSPGITMVGSAVFSLLGTRKLRTKDIDVAIVNQYWAEMAPLYMDIPTIVILHDVGLFESSIAQKEKTRHFLRQRILKRVVKKARKIIVPSKFTFEQLVKYLDVPKEKIAFIPEGVGLKMFRPSSLESSNRKVLCAGRFTPNKGHLILVEAFKELSRRTNWNGELYLVGHYTEKARDYFREIQRLADERIRIIKDVSDEELARYYQDADICVFPSVSDEGWGLTVVEAFASGKPVICSDLFEETGVATRERAYIVPRGDVQGLIDAMGVLIHSPELRVSLAKNGFEYAKGLSWEKMTKEIEKVIYEVA